MARSGFLGCVPRAFLGGAGDRPSEAQGEAEVGEDLEARVDDPQHADAEGVGVARDVQEGQHELVLRRLGQLEALQPQRHTERKQGVSARRIVRTL